MTPFPAPQHGRSAFFKGKVNFVAFAKDAQPVGTLYVYDPAFRVSIDAKRWRKALLRGNIRDALRSDGPLGECFIPVKHIAFKGYSILVGAMRRVSPSFQERAAIYIGRGGYRYDRVTLPSDLLNPTGSGIVDVAANDEYVAALGRNGVVHYWNGAGDWLSRSDLPMGVSPTTARHAGAIAAAPAGFVIAGAYGNNDGTAGATRLISGPTPAGTFTVRSLPTIGQLLLAAKGNVMLAASGAASAGDQRVITSGLTDLANWTAAGLTATGILDAFIYNGAKWLGLGGYNRFCYTSTAGSGGWTAVTDQTKTPWGVTTIERPLVNSILAVAGKVIAHWGYYSPSDAGGMTLSDDAETWERIDGVAAGLAARPYLLGSLAA